MSRYERTDSFILTIEADITDRTFIENAIAPN